MSQNRPKKVTEAYLERAALHYLGRFSATEAHLREVLTRKVRRRLEDGSEPSKEQMDWIVAVAAKCVRLGYVNDEQYANSRFQSLLRKGKPLRTIWQDLRYKGVPEEIAQKVFETAQEDPEQNIDLSAAAAYVRRRRFGPFRRADRSSPEKVEKEKAAMMRAGFSYGVVQEVLARTEEELLELLPK